jgi:hypothetical protein
MSRVRKATPSRFNLGDGDWVDLRPVRYGDRLEVSKKLFGYHVEANGSEGKKNTIKPTGEVHMRESNIELLRLAIAGWGGPGFCSLVDHDAGESHPGDCVPLAITAENIDGMDETGEKILEEIERRSKTPDFSKPSTPDSKATAETATAPATSVSTN